MYFKCHHVNLDFTNAVLLLYNDRRTSASELLHIWQTWPPCLQEWLHTLQCCFHIEHLFTYVCIVLSHDIGNNQWYQE